MENNQGKGQALDILKRFSIRVWSEALVNTTRGNFEGRILPRSENDDDKHLVIKAPTPYNIGVDIKLGWAPGQTYDRQEVKRLMLTPVSDEIQKKKPITVT